MKLYENMQLILLNDSFVYLYSLDSKHNYSNLFNIFKDFLGYE